VPSPAAGRHPNAGDSLLPEPVLGRVFRAGRRVRGGDVDPCGHLRLDALARYLQDVASDDTDDARLPDPMAWVVRRTVVEQRRPAHQGERLELATFCSGFGSRWAERRVSILGADALIDAVSVWVHVDAEGRPKPLPPEFHDLYDSAANGRRVNTRQTHDPIDPSASDAQRFDWHPRATDLDALDHVNNTIAWAVVEQLRSARLRGSAASGGAGGDILAGPLRAEVEYRDAVDRSQVDSGRPLVVVHRHDGDVTDLTLWSGDLTRAHVTARVGPLAS
jgi:acyl-ACP thioesterase